MKHGRIAAVIIAAALGCCLLSACGSSSGLQKNAASSASSSKTEEKGMDHDTGVFTVSVPAGWGIAPVDDLLKKYDGKTNPNSVYVLKEGMTSDDISRCAYFRVTFYKDARSYISTKGVYSDAKDIAPIQAGSRTWEGYSYSGAGFPGCCISAKDGNSLWVCQFVLKNYDSSMQLEDAEVKSILKSLKVK